MNVLVKRGDPLLKSDLDDISITNAKAILIMNPDQHEHVTTNMSKSDLFVIKTILSLGPLEFQYKPPIVVEIKHIETKEKITTLSRVVEQLHEHAIMPICFDKRLGQIIAQTLIENRIEDVYLSLFSFQGSEVYLLENVDFDLALKEYSHVVPLARSPKGLFVLSLNNAIKNKKSNHEFKPITLKKRKFSESHHLEVFIFGKNNKLSFILDSFRQYEVIHASKFKATWMDENELEAFVDEVNSKNSNTTILLLSDEVQDEDSLDANVINNLIYLEGHLTNPNVHIIVELLNPINDPIVKGFSIKNTIISNKIISLLLSKLALFNETSLFYEDLLTIAPNANNVDSQAIIIENAGFIINENFPLVFQSKKQLIESIYHTFNKEMMLIGYYKKKQLTIIEGDLHLKEEIVIQEEDSLILMKI